MRPGAIPVAAKRAQIVRGRGQHFAGAAVDTETENAARIDTAGVEADHTLADAAERAQAGPAFGTETVAHLVTVETSVAAGALIMWRRRHVALAVTRRRHRHRIAILDRARKLTVRPVALRIAFWLAVAVRRGTAVIVIAFRVAVLLVRSIFVGFAVE